MIIAVLSCRVRLFGALTTQRWLRYQQAVRKNREAEEDKQETFTGSSKTTRTAATVAMIDANNNAPQ